MKKILISIKLLTIFCYAGEEFSDNATQYNLQTATIDHHINNYENRFNEQVQPLLAIFNAKLCENPEQDKSVFFNTMLEIMDNYIWNDYRLSIEDKIFLAEEFNHRCNKKKPAYPINPPKDNFDN